jgi:hypothetical protein
MPSLAAGLVSQAEGQRRGKWTPVLIEGAKRRLCWDGPPERSRQSVWQHDEYSTKWLATQDAVFLNCAKDVDLPPLAQSRSGVSGGCRGTLSSAFRRRVGRFTAIGNDAGSPWRQLGPTLPRAPLCMPYERLGPTQPRLPLGARCSMSRAARWSERQKE